MSSDTPTSRSPQHAGVADLGPAVIPGADLIAELDARGLLKDCTDRKALAQHLDRRRTVYCGFDPSADSLTIGNLVPMMMLAHFRRAGHRVIVVQGGATGRVGDPSGKDRERGLRDDAEVEANLAAQRPIFERIVRDAPAELADVPSDAPDITIVDNHEWWSGKSFLWTLREVGKHFSVNSMIQRDAVRNRLEREDQGISFTEFSYMLLQAYDFLHLHQDEDCTVQLAGADQWGNIVSGCDLIRRRQHGSSTNADVADDADDIASSAHAFGLTAPLVTKADGTKFGKTEAGAIWLSARTGPDDASPHRTSAYAMYQFWLNASDDDALRWLKVFTFTPLDELEAIELQHAAEPFKRHAQRRLAEHATTIVHGRAAMERAQAAAQALFSGDVAQLDRDTLDDVFAAAPSSRHAKADLAGAGMAMIDAVASTSLASSKSEARKHLQAGSISVNGAKVAMDDALTADALLHGELALLRRGKKSWHVMRFA